MRTYGKILTTPLYFTPRSLTIIQDAERMSLKIHLTGFRTAHLQNYNLAFNFEINVHVF